MGRIQKSINRESLKKYNIVITGYYASIKITLDYLYIISKINLHKSK